MALQQTTEPNITKPPSPSVVSVLRADPDLAPALPANRRPEAERRSAARVFLTSGPQLEREPTLRGEEGYGLLVLSGALCRRIAHDELTAAEIVGPGDLIRPWEGFGGWSSLPLESHWAVVMPTQLAILDRSFAERVAPFPDIALGLTRRLVGRTARVATMLTALCQPRVEDRLITLFRHLADRFGRTRSDHVYVPLPLTHSLLSELVAARRPSVTKALVALREDGVLVRDPEGWLLKVSSGG
jgi:CRP/FNR family cyclic AMP-dependent transcriptional regulator